MDKIEKVIFLRLVVAGLKNLAVFVIAIAVAALLSMLCGCRGSRCGCEEVGSVDSVGVTRWTVEVPCTVYYDVPLIVERVQVKDTASRLENRFAWSEAWVDSSGLHHSLSTIPQEIEIPAQVQEVHEERERMKVVTRVVRVQEKTGVMGWLGKGSLFFGGGFFLGVLFVRVLSRDA